MSKPKKKTTPIQPRHIPPCFREALAMHEALRRLGFAADDIYCLRGPEELAVVLRTQGREFVITCGKHQMSEEQFSVLWLRAVALWNGTEPGMTATSRQIIYEGSEILKHGRGMGLLIALAQKGFQAPKVLGTLPELWSVTMSLGGSA